MRRVFAVLALCLGVALSLASDEPARSQPAPTVGKAQVGGRSTPDGKEIQVDLPNRYHMHNKGGSDGAGLCVFTSISHAAIYQGVTVLADFRDWMTKYPGGGWPEKVDKMIEKICTERKTSKPAYLQVEGADLEIIKLALKTGRMPCTTYSISPTGRYGGQKIAHMVNTVHMDETWAAVLDNNYPGDDAYEWMDLAAYRRAYASGSTGWTVILLANPPPPPPKN